MSTDRLVQFERLMVTPTLNESKRMARELLILRRAGDIVSRLFFYDWDYALEQVEEELIAEGILEKEE